MAKRTMLIAALVATSSPALASDLGALFADLGTCYARHYDQAHLKAHPDQHVETIFLTTLDLGNDEPLGGYDVILSLGFSLRGGEPFSSVAYCTGMSCALEGDAGSFELAPAAKDGLRLTVGEFLEVEGRRGTSGDLAASDDRVFLIYPARPAACAFD